MYGLNQSCLKIFGVSTIFSAKTMPHVRRFKISSDDSRLTESQFARYKALRTSKISDPPPQLSDELVHWRLYIHTHQRADPPFLRILAIVITRF